VVGVIEEEGHDGGEIILDLSVLTNSDATKRQDRTFFVKPIFVLLKMGFN
jgi:hypothetical protein